MKPLPLMVTLTLAIALAAGIVVAQERRLELKDAPGRAQVEANCGSCHSLDYIVMNSPFLDRSGWDGTVTKMIRVFGAPIKVDDAKAIVDYLNANYGKS
jgi:mono/diheme cytochrome c family protein